MASKLIVNLDSATPEQLASLYKQLVMGTAGMPSPEVEILVQHIQLETPPVQMPEGEVRVGLDGKPAPSLPTTSGLASR